MDPVRLNTSEYRLLVEHSPVLVWRAGLDAKCDYFNDTWLAFTGRSLQDELGDGWAGGVHADDLEPCVDTFRDHFARRAPFEMEYRLRRHDGVYRYIFDCGVPFDHDDGTFAGFIGSCVDVDDRRRAQAEREQRDAEQLAHARDFEQWILAIVSHDIRNPLANIDTAARLLASRAGDADSVRDFAERITRSAGRITHMVTDLLDLSRERHGGVPIQPAPACLDDIVRQVADEIATVSGRPIAIQGDPAAIGTWDAQRVAQAVSNLLGNAVQHSPGVAHLGPHRRRRRPGGARRAQRRRDPARGAADPLRTIRGERRFACTQEGPRPGPLHCAGRRACPWRQRPGRLEPRARDDVSVGATAVIGLKRR